MKKENMIFRLKMEIASLVNEMVAKLPDELFSSDSTTFLDPSMGGGQYVSAIENRLRTHGHTDKNIKSRVFGVEKNMLRVNYAIKKNKLVGTYSVDKNDIPSILIGYMKFDCIVGNPPYQKSIGGEKTEPIWHLFVENSIKSLKDSGHLCYVHPSGWRNVDGKFKDTGKLLSSKDVEYLEIHDEKDGMNTFGAMTRYDWYVLKNSPSSKKTSVKFQNGSTKIIDLNALSFIPNGSYDKIVSLLAKSDKDAVNIIYDRTKYGSDKANMSKEKTEKFKYPCFYCINKGDDTKFFYSSEKKGHFGISKFIWSNGYIPSFGCVVDPKGEYGMTQWCYAIVDEPKNLDNIKKAFDSKAFRDLMFDCKMSENSLNRKVLALFRKDFYKDFI
jgi:hypothetical protein